MTDEPQTTKTFLILMNLSASGGTQSHPWDEVGRRLGGWIRAHQPPAQLVSYYATLGPYDFAAVVKVEDEEQVLQLALELAEQGYVTPMSMRAFDLQAKELGATGNYR
jgi:uncharacterized protein with GYD domain